MLLKHGSCSSPRHHAPPLSARASRARYFASVIACGVAIGILLSLNDIQSLLRPALPALDQLGIRHPQRRTTVDLSAPASVYGVTRKAGPVAYLTRGKPLGRMQIWELERGNGVDQHQGHHLPYCTVFYNDKYKVIYLKTPKAAGNTVSSYFTMCDAPGATDRCFSQLLLTNATDVQHILDKWAEYYVFGFSRNVWSRAVSQFKYLTNSSFMHNYEQCGVSWQSFCADPYSLGDTCFRRGHDCCIASPEHQWVHVIPQTTCLWTESQELAVDFLGRSERLADDFIELVRQLNARGEVERMPEYVPETVNVNKAPCDQGTGEGRGLLFNGALYNPCNKTHFFDGPWSQCIGGIESFFASDISLLHLDLQ